MFRYPAWAVGSHSSGLPAAGTVGTKSTGGFYQADGSPCIGFENLDSKIISTPLLKGL